MRIPGQAGRVNMSCVGGVGSEGRARIYVGDDGAAGTN